MSARRSASTAARPDVAADAPNLSEDAQLDRHVLLIRQRYVLVHHIGAALVVVCWLLNLAGAMYDPRLSIPALALLLPAVLMMLPWWGQHSRWQARLEVSEQTIQASWRAGLLARPRTVRLPTAEATPDLVTTRHETALFLQRGVALRGLVLSSAEQSRLQGILQDTVSRAIARVGRGEAEIPAALRSVRREADGQPA